MATPTLIVFARCAQSTRLSLGTTRRHKCRDRPNLRGPARSFMLRPNSNPQATSPTANQGTYVPKSVSVREPTIRYDLLPRGRARRVLRQVIEGNTGAPSIILAPN